MMGNNQNLFFSPGGKGQGILRCVKRSAGSIFPVNIPHLMVEGGNDEVKQQVKRYISKYIYRLPHHRKGKDKGRTD